MIDFSEDFASDPGGGFATAAYKSLSLTVSYNAAATAVDLSMGNDQSIWAITSQPVTPDTEQLIFEADLELASDPSGRKHLGLWLVQDTTLVMGYRIAHLDNGWVFSRWSAWTGETSLTKTDVSNPSFNLGERKRVKVVTTGARFDVYVDDVLCFYADDGTYNNLRPGIFQYGCTNRVHGLTYQSAALDISFVALAGADFSWANAETQAQAWPGENHWADLPAMAPAASHQLLRVPHYSTPPARADLGYIAGIVTRQQVPAVGQRVLCFDQSMNLVAETRSGAGGAYRFDGLDRFQLYTILAQDNWEFAYAPAGADRRTPEAYS